MNNSILSSTESSLTDSEDEGFDDIDSILNSDLSSDSLASSPYPELTPADYSELVANLPPLEGFINTSLNIDSIPPTTIASFNRNLASLLETQENKFFFVSQMMRTIQSTPSLLSILRPDDVKAMVAALQSEYRLVSYIKAAGKAKREKAATVKASLSNSIATVDCDF